MNITFPRRTDLAVSVLRVLHESGGVLAGPTLADRVGTTVTYLPQVVAPLIRAGWVVSERGPGGGYRVTDNAYDASLLDVIEATEGPGKEGRCVLKDKPCPGDEACPVHVVWTRARDHLVSGFQTIPAIDPEGENE